MSPVRMRLKAWKDFERWVQPQQQDHPAFQELGQEVVAGLEKMLQTANKFEGKMSALQAEILPHMYELFVNLAIYQLVAGCRASQYRIVAGVPIIFCWKGVSILQSLSERMTSCEIPTEFLPVLQPMGDAFLLQKGAFSKVLQVAAADAKWQTLVTPDHPSIQDIRRLKEQWAPSMAMGLPGVGVVRRLLSVKAAQHVASHAGDLYVYSLDGKLVRYDGVGDQVSFKCRYSMKDGMAIGDAMEGDGCIVVGGGERILFNYVSVGSVSGTDHAIVENWKKIKAACGFSLTGYHAYFCSGNRVFSLDMQAQCIRPLIGHAFAWTDGKKPLEQLLVRPTDTAVFRRRLFIADDGKVLCFDRKKNECQVVFKGLGPRHIAAYHGGLFVYDHCQRKIFHVTMGTWEVRHVLGTGISGNLFDSEEGLPPLSTNLRTITSMTVYRDGKLAFLYEDDPIVREFRMPSPSILPVGTACASHVKLFHQGQDDEEDALLPLQGPDLQPPLPTHYQPFSAGSTPMCLSETLPGDKRKFIFRFELGRATHGLGICLVTETPGPSGSRPVDCHIFSPTEWNGQTHVTTLSQIMREHEQVQLDNQPFRKLWKKAIDAFHTVVMNADTTASLAKPFFLEDENYFKVEVERTYDADAHSSTWKLVKVYVKAGRGWKVRAGSLDELAVGVAVPVRICIFAAMGGGGLEFLDEPRLTAH